MATILLLDDDVAICTVVSAALKREGHRVIAVGSIAAARPEIVKADLFITDVILPDGNGLDALEGLTESAPDLPVIVLSAQNTLTTAVRATERGAFDYLPKPFDLVVLCQAVASGLASRGARVDGPLEEPETLPLIGRSPAMQEVYRTLARVIPNDLTVLLLGESGTGKEVVARVIHDLGPRKAAPFVAVNMAAIPRELIESELFGHERGAFTGAQARTSGRFEQAQGGTLFLDEIGDMPMEAQTRLLRVLQSGEFSTVGGGRTIRADVRIVAATHKNLPAMIAEHSFREDLFYRINVVPIALPPLRQRREDVAVLARHFLDRATHEGLPRKWLDDAAAVRLAQHNWPGNVRELENLMRRLAVLTREEVISVAIVEGQIGQSFPIIADVASGSDLSKAVAGYLSGYFAAHGGALPPDGLYDRVLADVERPLLEATLRATGGNQLRAAALLGLNRNTLRRKLLDHAIDAGEARRTPG